MKYLSISKIKQMLHAKGYPRFGKALRPASKPDKVPDVPAEPRTGQEAG